MRHLLFTVSLAMATASMNCFAADRGTDKEKPAFGKAMVSAFQARNTQGLPFIASLNETPSKAAPLVTPKAILFDSADGEITFRAFSLYDTKIRSVSAMVKFNSQHPNEYELVRDFTSAGDGYRYIGACTYIGDKAYAYTMSSYPGFPGMIMPPVSLCEIDLETGEMTQVADWGNLVLSDIVYDPYSGYLYGVAYNFTDGLYFTDVYRVSPDDFTKIEQIAHVDNDLLYSIAVDNGYIYAIVGNPKDKDAQLKRFDPRKLDFNTGQLVSDLKAEPVGGMLGLDVAPAFQDMVIDMTTHRLFWWAQISDGRGGGESYLIELNKDTGEMLSMEKITADAQLVGLAAPYQIAADGAPGMVTQYSVSLEATDLNQVRLQWTNPSVNYQRGSLSEITSVNIYRDGELVGTVSGMTPAGKGSFTDRNVPTGNYVYRVQPCNSSGPGLYKEQQIYAGYDTPEAPKNLTLVAEGNKGKLSWTAPQKGQHGGTINSNTIKYDVLRYPDEVKVATDLSVTTFTDEVTELKGYYYAVTAKSDEGKGGTATSNTVAYGADAAIPFINSLRTQEDFALWNPVDNNHDGTTWYYNIGQTLYQYCLNSADDYLFSPRLKLEAGKEYQVRYGYDDAHWVDNNSEPVNERLAVHYGTELSVEGLLPIASHDCIHNSLTTPIRGKANFKAKSNSGYVAFHCWSEPDRGILYLSDISIREYSPTDVSVVNINGSETVNCNVKQIFNVTIGNEGNAAVSGYKVVLFNADNQEVLGEANGGEIAKDATLVVPVEWIPKTTGNIQVSARVEMPGDTYPADNVATDTIMVSAKDENADKFFTVNKSTTYGWAFPFYLNWSYCQTQSIFLDTEMSLKNIGLTGIQLTYDNEGDQALVTTPVRISVKNTDESYFMTDDEWRVYLIKGDDWTVVYEGDIVINQIANDVKLYIPFDRQFDYTGGNIVFKFERLYSPYNTLVEGPSWEFCETGRDNESMRSALYTTNKADEAEVINDRKTGRQGFTPYLAFSYKDLTKDGIEGVLNMGSVGFSASQVGNEVRFNVACQQVEVFDTAGKLVASMAEAKTLDVAGYAAGLYVVRAKVGGKPVVAKFIVK